MISAFLFVRALASAAQGAESFLRWWLALWLVVFYVIGVAWWCWRG